MKTSNLFTIIVFCLMTLPTSLVHSQKKVQSFVPHIQYKEATLSGKIEGLNPGEKGFKHLTLCFSRVITTDIAQYDIPVNKDGTFSISIPVESMVDAGIFSDYYEGLIILLPGEETRLEIHYDKDQKKQVRIVNSLGLTADDGTKIKEVLMKAIDRPWGKSDMLPDQFSQDVVKELDEVLRTIKQDTTLSTAVKQIVASELKVMISGYLFIKAEDLILSSHNKIDTNPETSHPVLPDKSYYSFLKFLNMNDPSNLSANHYCMVFQYILRNEKLAIPDIEETPVDIWITKAKEILEEVVGYDSGLFYDVLAANAFTKQMNGMEPLSEVQKKNIRSYFRDPSLVNILINENEKVLKFAAQAKPTIHIMGKTSRDVMDSILSKYQGKVIFVDFWTTWCMPCWTAMRESECVKKEFENKEVVFVDITNPSSPPKLWEERISTIGGEHYYVTKDEWTRLCKAYNISGIPHYLIFDKKGELKTNHSPFMGLEQMREWIEKLL